MSDYQMLRGAVGDEQVDLALKWTRDPDMARRLLASGATIDAEGKWTPMRQLTADDIKKMQENLASLMSEEIGSP